MRLHPKIFVSSVVSFALLTIVSCSEPTSSTSNPPLVDSSSVSSSGTLKFQGEIISIPSPTQIAVILQKASIPYQQGVVNPLTNASKYTGEFKKAMNMGVYGADLAYIANYEQGQINNDYFETIGDLAGELQILEHIDKSLLSRLANNISNKDSLLSLNAQFFRAGDQYLKNAERSDLAGLILLGGWVEALYLSMDAAITNKDIRSMLGDQKHAAASLVSLMSKYNEPSLEKVKVEMLALGEVFQEMESSYEYQKPINDTKEKTTYLRSKSNVIVSDDQLSALREKTNSLRNLIIQ
jgi:hypothetical protein